MDRELLSKHGLKVTPQRLAVLEAMRALTNHPSAESTIDYIRRNHPNIAVGTIYKTLDTFASMGIIDRVKTERDAMRYDFILEKHHHLYCTSSSRIEDYEDEELNTILEEYFKRKGIPHFMIEEIRLQLSGRFTDR